MTLLMSYLPSPHLVAPLVDAKTVHQQKKGPNLTRFISKCTLHLADRTQAAIYALQKRVVPLNEALDKETPP